METTLLERDPKLAEVVRRLVDAYQPERIYLFGSVARGEAEPDSDYDLLVVVPDDAPPGAKGQQTGLPSSLGYQGRCRRDRLGEVAL